MRLVTLATPAGPRLSVSTPNGYLDLQTDDATLPTSLKGLLKLGATGFDRAKAALAHARPVAGEGLRVLTPILDPDKLLCVGLNYADHAKETGAKLPTEPVIFNKLPTTLLAANETIVLPRVSSEVDYEAELVVVIGRGGRHIPRTQAMSHVAGYCCGNDVSARDWQKGKPGGQWLLGKSFDTFAPLGPEFVTADEVRDPGNLGIRLRLNGQVMQNSRTNQLIFPIDELIAYISTVCTLAVGDLIFTGTPSGVGMARKPPVFLKAGDRVEVEIDSVGLLANSVASETA